jgi:2-polyprenyl-3-methyl-5-hydroxy-6-metoxy-1,4-benzoquinol methylase
LTEGRACEVYGGRDFKEIAALDAATRVFRCRACGLYVVDPVRRWDKAKDDFSQLDLESWIGYMEGFRRGQYRKDLEVIGKYKSAGKLLDVGCACGFFLDDAAKRGFEVRGIEPAHTAVEYARKRFHADVLEGELGSVDVGAEGFDVVSMFAVLEHTAAPTEVVAELHRLLKPGGLAVVKVPRSDALAPWLIYSAYRWTFGRVAAPLRSLYEWSFQ